MKHNHQTNEHEAACQDRLRADLEPSAAVVSVESHYTIVAISTLLYLTSLCKYTTKQRVGQHVRQKRGRRRSGYKKGYLRVSQTPPGLYFFIIVIINIENILSTLQNLPYCSRSPVLTSPGTQFFWAKEVAASRIAKCTWAYIQCLSGFYTWFEVVNRWQQEWIGDYYRCSR